MLKIFIDFSPLKGEGENITNGIKVITDTTKVQLDDLFSALSVCAAMRRISSILDTMIIEINRNNVKIIPTDKNFKEVAGEDAAFVPADKIPYAHLFFKDLRFDINEGVQDHLNLEENPIIKKKKKRPKSKIITTKRGKGKGKKR